MNTGPSLAAFLARLAAWLNSLLVSVAIVMAMPVLRSQTMVRSYNPNFALIAGSLTSPHDMRAGAPIEITP
jgi:hypothetical protein